MIKIKQKHLYLWGVRATLTIAALGFVFNYMTLVLVARAYQMNWLQVAIFPLLLDAFMVVSHLVFFFLVINGHRARLPLAAMGLTVTLSVAFNLSHVWGLVGWLGYVAWGLPPVWLLVSVVFIAHLVRAAMVVRPVYNDVIEDVQLPLPTDSPIAQLDPPDVQPVRTAAQQVEQLWTDGVQQVEQLWTDGVQNYSEIGRRTGIDRRRVKTIVQGLNNGQHN